MFEEALSIVIISYLHFIQQFRFKLLNVSVLDVSSQVFVAAFKNHTHERVCGWKILYAPIFPLLYRGNFYCS